MDNTTPPLPAVPWYTSAGQKANVITAVSALVAISPTAAKMIGIKTPDDVTTIVTAVFTLAAFVVPVIAGFLRARSPLQPLTLTQAAADVHPATIAAVIAATPTLPITPVPTMRVPAANIPAKLTPGAPWGTTELPK